MRLRLIVVKVIVLFVGLSITLAESQSNTKLKELFKVSWSSMSYNKTIYNPAAPSRAQNQGTQSSLESISLGCEIEILDPNLILGTSRQPIITQITDYKGQNINTGLKQPDLRHLSYDGLNYRTRHVSPPRPPKWKTVVRSALRLRQEASSRLKLVTELQPSRMHVQLDVGLCKRAGKEISLLEGYFYALMAESYEHIEVPFEPNDNWVPLTSDLEIQVREALNTESSYRFNIKERRLGRTHMNRLSVGNLIPERIVVARQFINSDGKPSLHHGGFRSIPAHVGGSGSAGGNVDRIEKIRFVIAINPIQYEVPFKLEHIPLPDPLQRK
jgi:hypothetical protein